MLWYWVVLHVHDDLDYGCLCSSSRDRAGNTIFAVRAVVALYLDPIDPA